jgi:hypothetical protein
MESVDTAYARPFLRRHPYFAFAIGCVPQESPRSSFRTLSRPVQTIQPCWKPMWTANPRPPLEPRILPGPHTSGLQCEGPSHGSSVWQRALCTQLGKHKTSRRCTTFPLPSMLYFERGWGVGFEVAVDYYGATTHEFADLGTKLGLILFGPARMRGCRPPIFFYLFVGDDNLSTVLHVHVVQVRVSIVRVDGAPPADLPRRDLYSTAH